MQKQPEQQRIGWMDFLQKNFEIGSISLKKTTALLLEAYHQENHGHEKQALNSYLEVIAQNCTSILIYLKAARIALSLSDHSTASSLLQAALQLKTSTKNNT